MGCTISIRRLTEGQVFQTEDVKHAFVADLMARIGQDWISKPESEDFWLALWSGNGECCVELLDKLHLLYHKQGRGIALKAAHVDIVIASWEKLQELPSNILSSLDAYLHTNSIEVHAKTRPTIQSVIQNLRVEHAPALTIQADLHNLQHHTVYHALEIKVRAMEILTKQLGLLNAHSDRDIFLQEIVSFFIEFHDHEQKIRGLDTSVEQVTAARVAAWVIDALELTHRAPELVPLIEIFSDWIIVLGTTMIWGPNSTMDLIELFFLFDEAAKQAGLAVDDVSNQSLIHLLGVVALVTGVCDKNPAASEYLMKSEMEQMHSLECVRKYIKKPLILERFMGLKGELLLPYFQQASSLTNRQTWLTTWVPHLNMRTELSIADPELGQFARSLINLIKKFQQKCGLGFNETELKTWFDNECSSSRFKVMFESLFFTEREKNIEKDGVQTTIQVSGLIGEMAFSNSQVDTLIFACKQLPYLLSLWDGRDYEHAKMTLGIEPNVPKIDAQNMEQFKHFYANCYEQDKEQLIQELFLVSVCQIGMNYALRPELTYKPNYSFTEEHTEHHFRFFRTRSSFFDHSVRTPHSLGANSDIISMHPNQKPS